MRPFAFVICNYSPLAPLRALDYLVPNGGWAGRLCTGLQIHEDRFDSGTRLHSSDKTRNYFHISPWLHKSRTFI